MTYQAKDLCFYDECDIRDLLKAARKNGAETVCIYSADWGEEKFNLADGKDAIIEFLDGADMDWAFRFFDKDDEHLGTFYVVLGNDDGSAVYDSSAQKWCDKVWDGIA